MRRVGQATVGSKTDPVDILVLVPCLTLHIRTVERGSHREQEGHAPSSTTNIYLQPRDSDVLLYSVYPAS